MHYRKICRGFCWQLFTAVLSKNCPCHQKGHSSTQEREDSPWKKAKKGHYGHQQKWCKALLPANRRQPREWPVSAKQHKRRRGRLIWWGCYNGQWIFFQGILYFSCFCLFGFLIMVNKSCFYCCSVMCCRCYCWSISPWRKKKILRRLSTISQVKRVHIFQPQFKCTWNV